MIKFKKNYYQMKTNGNKLSIRFANYRVSPDYLYDAFKDKDGDNDYMYIAAYPGSKRLDGNILSASSDIPLNETMSYYRDNKTDDGDGYHGNLTSLNEYKLEKFMEFKYTNIYGYAEDYVVFKANGFFTKLKDNTRVRISIKVDD